MFPPTKLLLRIRVSNGEYAIAAQLLANWSQTEKSKGTVILQKRLLEIRTQGDHTVGKQTMRVEHRESSLISDDYAYAFNTPPPPHECFDSSFCFFFVFRIVQW